MPSWREVFGNVAKGSCVMHALLIKTPADTSRGGGAIEQTSRLPAQPGFRPGTEACASAAVSIASAAAKNVVEFARATMTSMPGGYDERWLQELLFAHPELIPLDRIDPGAGDVVPLCRELTLAREGGVVYLDLLCVTRSGRLMLIECKLWRNPQARREVVAQILEYAALLRGWSYGDLTARLKQQRGWRGANPIYEQARQIWPELDEGAFVDAVSRSLDAADFHLVIAGDGIRSDVQALASHVNASGAGTSRLALVEIQVWRSGDGDTIVVPNVPLKTEVIEQRVIVAADGQHLKVKEVHVDSPAGVRDRSDTADADAIVDPDRAAQRESNKVFWDRFIAGSSFDHPDQGPPRHGGNNWVKIDLDGPVSWLTAYRSNDKMGFFLSLTDEEGRALADTFAEQLDGLREESGLDLSLNTRTLEPFKAEFAVVRNRTGLSDEEQLTWLWETANRMVTLLRPLLSSWQSEHSAESAN